MIISREVTVRYLWFSADFDPRDNFFSSLIESVGLKVKVIEDPKTYADLEIVSVFPPKRRRISAIFNSISQNYPYGVLDYELKALTFRYLPRGNSKRRIWYTGENIRPPLLEDFDFYFSFDQDDFGGKNFYLPLYYQEIGLGDFENRVRVQTAGDQLVLYKGREKSDRQKFACTFFSNPHAIRLAAIESLRSIGEIDVFGRGVGKPVQFKEELASEYKFVLCFENDLYPGYITEKLIDAYKCGAVPLYWGDLGIDEVINKDAFVNLKDFQTLADFNSFLGNMTPKQYSILQQAPMLKKIPDISDIVNVLTSF